MTRLGSSVVERSPEEAGVVSSILTRGTSRYGLMVEHVLAKDETRVRFSLAAQRNKIPSLTGYLILPCWATSENRKPERSEALRALNPAGFRSEAGSTGFVSGW